MATNVNVGIPFLSPSLFSPPLLSPHPLSPYLSVLLHHLWFALTLAFIPAFGPPDTLCSFYRVRYTWVFPWALLPAPSPTWAPTLCHPAAHLPLPKFLHFCVQFFCLYIFYHFLRVVLPGSKGMTFLTFLMHIMDVSMF